MTVIVNLYLYIKNYHRSRSFTKIYGNSKFMTFGVNFQCKFILELSYNESKCRSNLKPIVLFH